MPMENTGSGAGNTKLLRLLRLPRLWRLVKLVRLLRMSKVLKNSKQLEKFKEALNLNEGVQGLLNIFMTVFLLNHIASCFFFFIAKFYDFPPDCWVVVEGVLDAEINK
jgi:hyperpolarization activated cyclic nucleotide-gated potassium channel 2